MIHGSMTHDFTGRKRKSRKTTGEVYRKCTAPPSAHNRARPAYRRDEPVYKSVDCGGINTAAPEKKEYTGTLVKGIGTMHKSNAVPIIDEQQMKDLASMRR